MQTYHLDIITPVRNAFSEDVEYVSVPTKMGTVGVLPHHVGLFSSLTEGEIKIKTKQKEMFLAIGGGFMEIRGNAVTLLVSRAYHADELNETEIKKAQTAAKEAIARRTSGAELSDAYSLLRRSFIEMKVLRRYKAKHII
ncbi:ATP synthase F1 subunit epsilon [Candidatus Gottesmanbacteria bacterium]|nr:ATP synthase F1 subunit epsilon [Candidatus Gottesmanbacteria bacterium]